MITKPRFVTIDTDNFGNGQMPVWDADNHKFINSSDSAAITIKGDWVDDTDYVKNDVVYVDGSSYVCILAHTSASTNEPGVGVDTDTYWQEFAAKGDTGATGAAGADGADGAPGTPGADGADGVGVPAGGTAGQVLAKNSSTDYDTEWVDQTGGSGSDGINFIGPWETATTYNENDGVSNDGSSYVCISAHTSASTNEPGVGVDTNLYWMVLAEKGEPGEPGTAGSDGAPGADGADGLSAYEVAVDEGFIGDETAWLASLKGEKGDKGDTGSGSTISVSDGTTITNNVETIVFGDATVLDNEDGSVTVTPTAPTFIAPRVATTTSSATPTPNADTTDHFILTALAEAAAFANPTGTPASGQKLLIQIYSAAAQGLTWDTDYVARGADLPSTTTAGKWMTIGFIYNAAESTFDCVAVAEEA